MRMQYQSSGVLAASAVSATQWFSNGDSASQYVRATSYSDQQGSLALWQTDSPTGLIEANILVAQVTASGGSLAKIEAAITAQFWQLIYTNGPIAQVQFQFSVFSTAEMSLAVLLELQRLNLQILGMRSPKDNAMDDTYQALR